MALLNCGPGPLAADFVNGMFAPQVGHLEDRNYILKANVREVRYVGAFARHRSISQIERQQCEQDSRVRSHVCAVRSAEAEPQLLQLV